MRNVDANVGGGGYGQWDIRGRYASPDDSDANANANDDGDANTANALWMDI